MKYSKTKRGRPRKNRTKIDRGTIELQQKRKALLCQENGHNLRLTESLLGVFYARDLVSQPLYEAGCFFGELGYRYEACLGEASPKRCNILMRQEGRGECSDETDAQHTKAWHQALEALKEAGPHSFQTVLKVVFYDQDLYTNSPPRVAFEDLRQGLASLERYFKRTALKDTRRRFDDRAENPARSTRFPRPLKDDPPQPLP